MFRRYPTITSDDQKPSKLDWKQFYDKIGRDREAKIKEFSKLAAAKMRDENQSRAQSGARLIDFKTAQNKLSKKPNSSAAGGGGAGGGGGKPHNSLFASAAKQFSAQKTALNRAKATVHAQRF